MSITTSNILKGIVLLGSIAHVMIYFNGLWNDVFWMTALLVVCIPVVVYKFMPKNQKKKRSRQMSAEI